MSVKFGLIGAAAVFLTACNSTPPARDFSGSWQPLNSFPAQTKEIPLVNQHIYRAMTIDVTLKSMLGRWAKEAGLRLRYEHPSDFVVHAPVAQIQQPNLGEALDEVNAIFAEQNVHAEVFAGELVVRSTIANTLNSEVSPQLMSEPLPVLRPLPSFPVFNNTPPPAAEPLVAPAVSIKTPSAQSADAASVPDYVQKLNELLAEQSKPSN